MLAFSRGVSACGPCNVPHVPAELILFNEPFWSKSEIPKDKRGTAVITFDLSKSGKPLNIKITKVNPSSLNKSKLLRAITNSKFRTEIDVCKQLKREKNKKLTYTFELTFENFLAF